MNFMATPDDEHGEAGDTGSAMHKAADAMHKGKELAECLQVMHAGIAKYPKADLADAASLFLSYAADTRNRNADIVVSEQPLAFSIAPAEDDPTQAPIEVIGTGDQVRRENGRLKYWDIKTSKKEATGLVDSHMFQAAAYCIGLTIALGEPVHPGGLILPRKYKAQSVSTSPVFWPFAWNFEDIEHILEPVRRRVSEIRRGLLYHVPGDYCFWCPAKSADLCLPRLKKFKLQMANAT
jgi:hypothetical protein